MPYAAPEDVLSEWAVDVDDVRAGHDTVPWRQPLLANGDVRAVLICWAPGFWSIPHFHPHATETFQVISGRLGFRLDDRDELEIRAGDIAIAHRGQIHGLRVLGEEPMVLLACVSPNEDVDDEQVDVPDAWPDWPAVPASDPGMSASGPPVSAADPAVATVDPVRR